MPYLMVSLTTKQRVCLTAVQGPSMAPGGGLGAAVALLCSAVVCVMGDDYVPKITWPTQHGLIIDAGSTGSRMHVYEWDARRFRTVPPPLSYPLTSNRWTDRLA